MPKLDGILETAIHTENMPRSRAFYEDVLGLKPIYSDDRLTGYAVAGRDVLLVFLKGATTQTVVLPSGTIPGHGRAGRAARGIRHRQGRACTLGSPSRFARRDNRRPQRLGARRTQHLFPRS